MKIKSMKISGFTLCLSCFLVFSCVTDNQSVSYNNYQDYPGYYILKIESVTVTIDMVRDSSIAEQITMVADTYLQSRQIQDIFAEKTLYLDIVITQRTFLDNLNQKNSIYISCLAHDQEGNIFARETEAVSGNRTIISSVEQNIIVRRILDKFLINQKERYAEVKASSL